MRYGAANCVEVAEAGDGYALRDSKQHGHGPILTFTRAEWAAFVEGVKFGEFDPLAARTIPTVRHQLDRVWSVLEWRVTRHGRGGQRTCRTATG